MALARDYRERVLSRIQKDRAFASELYRRALEALFAGEQDLALGILRDMVHALIGFRPLAANTGLHEKALHRAIRDGARPRLETLLPILRELDRALDVEAEITVKARPARRKRRALARA